MDIGIYGLGRMGGNMVTRLLRGGHRVVAGNRSPGPVDEKKAEGAVGAYSVEELVKALKAPRVLWAMVPAGEATDHLLDEFAKYAAKGDVWSMVGTRTFATRCGARRSTRPWVSASSTSACPVGSGAFRWATA